MKLLRQFPALAFTLVLLSLLGRLHRAAQFARS